MKAEAVTETKPFEPIPIYHEGVFDRRYWYTLQAKRYMKQQWGVFEEKVNLIFEEHRLTA